MFAHAFFKYAWLARFCESYADKIFVNLIVIKRTIHGEAVVYVCDFQGIVLFT